MGISQRWTLNALSDLLSVLADPVATKAKIDEWKAATEDYDRAKKEHDQALDGANAAINEAEEKRQSLELDVAKFERERQDFHTNQAQHWESVKETTRSMGEQATAFGQAKADHENAVTYAMAVLDNRERDLYLREAQVSQAQRAVDARASILAAAERSLADREQSLAHRLSELKRLAG